MSKSAKTSTWIVSKLSYDEKQRLLNGIKESEPIGKMFAAHLVSNYVNKKVVSSGPRA